MFRRVAASLAAFASVAALAAPLADPALNAGENIRQETGEITVNGSAVTVVRYTWRDSGGDPRSVSLVPASSSTMGYAVQMSYTVVDGTKRTVFVNADAAADGGFGYFVSHELFRNFSNGTSDTIASLHGEDDSPLARYLPSTGSAQSVGNGQATQEFRLNYPRWGTVAAIPDPSTGTISTDPTTHQRFLLPVVVRWHFVAGKDYPLWTVDYDLTAAADHIATDVRGPYGAMRFNEGIGPDVTALKWGDKYLFSADAGNGDFGTAAINNLAWNWSVLNTGRRYNVLASGNYEMGLVDIVPYSASRYADGFSDHRGLTGAAGTCAYGMTSLPCDWEWAYQSFQYDYGPPARPKLAWGSSPLLGSSTNPVYITNTESETIIGGKGHIHYGMHIVVGRSGAGAPQTLARAAAALETAPTLTLAVSPPGAGTLSYSVLGDTGGPYTTSGTLSPWDSVTLTATPGSSSVFSAWTGACAGVTGPTCVITMDQAQSVTANFIVSEPPPPNPARLVNLSTRGRVGTGNNVMIAGFIIGGPTPKTVVVTGIGPSLASYGIANALPNPTLTLVRSSDQAVIGTNDDWGSAVNASQIQSAGFAPADPREAAIMMTLPPGAYTAIVADASSQTGVGIVAAYEVDHPEVPLINMSTRGQVLTGNDVMIAGLVVAGTSPQTVVVTGIGPSLAAAGIANPLGNPTLTLVRASDSAIIATNDDWGSASNAAQIQAAGLAPSDPSEAAIMITLQPGAYTAILSGAGNTTGVGIVAVYRQ